MNIAIDGPAGAGKSTIAKRLAKELSFIYVDTGAMYRAMALYCLRNGIDTNSREEVEKNTDQMNVSLGYEDGTQQVYLNGENVSGLIRTEEVSRNTSVVSAYPLVREKMTNLQRELAAKENVVMDGRDIGTVVLPNAELKIFLTASVDTRAERRYKEQMEKGEEQVDLEAIKQDIRERDERDMNREIAPLRQAEDAVFIDSSYMTIEEVTATMISYAKERM